MLRLPLSLSSWGFEVAEEVIEVRNVVTRFDDLTVHDGVSFKVERGTIVALIGGSGTGKSTLLREIIGLLPPTGGETYLFGKNVWNVSLDELDVLRDRFGVLFQNGALFSALNVGENVAAPLREQTDTPEELIDDIVELRLALVGLGPEIATKMPSELSGGMRKRVALARALALEPEVLFLDEPTSGLDPINARAFDSLIQTLCHALGLTVFMVTHDLDTICTTAERIIVLDSGKVLADGKLEQIVRVDNPWIKEYFSSRVQIGQA